MNQFHVTEYCYLVQNSIFSAICSWKVVQTLLSSFVQSRLSKCLQSQFKQSQSNELTSFNMRGNHEIWESPLLITQMLKLNKYKQNN